MAITIRIAAVTAATALTIGLAAPASAQTNVLSLINTINSGIETVDCGTLEAGLRGVGLIDDNTTRSELVKDLNNLVGDDASIKLISAPTINTVGDRALECKIVKADPVTPVDQAIAFSSHMSSQVGLPEIRNLLPVLGL
ncbi:hypothetical protein [Corynebacterium cystitidis]|uniref:Alpha helical Porin B n=1 Tax=Corynebacterium cystitidis DSM 20524 TaxID=1121357 RepID=A0A1H9WB62_9CORY|nr:hypothetical protein [Corynebacterium cystitidis]WJY82966.1 Alpha helical Porin B [Corynebacterium cystitidis DSM 20524]SES31182.1 Alpha helical Porin B [Corynebacterium cystitidis DSM 20524]SNV68082.1 putative secreted protein [Corynebacterium cystitidis]